MLSRVLFAIQYGGLFFLLQILALGHWSRNHRQRKLLHNHVLIKILQRRIKYIEMKYY